MNDQLVAYLKYISKSVLTFLGMVTTNAAIDLMQSGKPWPEKPAEWVRWAASIFLVTWIVYQVPNGPKPRHARVGAGE